MAIIDVGFICKNNFEFPHPTKFRTPPARKQVVPLESAWKRLTGEAQIAPTSISAPMVFCTRNFLVGTMQSEMSSLDDYLRPVDAALAFTDGRMLLLSEREANGVLLALARSRETGGSTTGGSTQPKLIHLSYAGSEPGGERISTNPLMREATREHGTLRRAALARIWVFGGITTIPADGRDAVKTFIKGKWSAVKHIVAARGHGHMLPRSDLERLLT